MKKRRYRQFYATVIGFFGIATSISIAHAQSHEDDDILTLFTTMLFTMIQVSPLQPGNKEQDPTRGQRVEATLPTYPIIPSPISAGQIPPNTPVNGI